MSQSSMANSKPYNYIADGRGRDLYISCNNGGMFKNYVIPHGSISQPNFHYKNLNIHKDARILKFHSDGTGRDTYILGDNGGLSRTHKSLASFQLKDFLRTQTGNLKFHNRTQFPLNSTQGVNYASKDEKILNKTQSQIWKKSVDKLYYQDTEIKQDENFEKVIDNFFNEKSRKLKDINNNKIFNNLDTIGFKTSKNVINSFNKSQTDEINKKRAYNLSSHVFPHQRNHLYSENQFINDVKNELKSYKDFSEKKKKVKQLLFNCHVIDKVLK